MGSWKFEDWCQQAVSQIKYRPDREMVQRELKAHMEDRYEAYRERGLSEQEAEVRALEAMGSAQEIAPQLAAIHRPFWGYLLSVSRYVLIVLACILIVPMFKYVKNMGIRDKDYLYDPARLRDPYIQEEFNGGRRILYLEPGVEARSDGYIFRVTKAAVWEWDESDVHVFHFQMDVIDSRSWVEDADIGRWFWAKDDQGNYYASFYESIPGERYVSGNSYRTGFFTRTYEMWLSGYEGEDLQWVDLHYDRSGRDITLRIDLTGGEAHE